MSTKPATIIAALRKRRRLTQQQVAEAVGAHWITISKLERGQLKLSLDWAQRLARVLKVEVEDIVAGEVYPKQIPIAGTIGAEGVVYFGPSSITEVSFDLDFYSNATDDWYVVNTMDFFPIIQSSDIVRVTPVDRGKLDGYIQRICLVELLSKQSRQLFGILGRNHTDGTTQLTRTNGAVLDVGPFKILGCMTMAILGVAQLGDLKLRAARVGELDPEATREPRLS